MYAFNDCIFGNIPSRHPNDELLTIEVESKSGDFGSSAQTERALDQSLNGRPSSFSSFTSESQAPIQTLYLSASNCTRRMSGHPVLDYASNVYLTITTSPHSIGSVADAHPALTYVGPVGSLTDVHIVSVPKDAWLANGSNILSRVKAFDGVAGVEVQPEPRRRTKRGDEL